jgi:hypothetical protein
MRYRQVSQIYGVVVCASSAGAIGQKHTTIYCPPPIGSTQYKYKNLHSDILKAVADATVDAGECDLSSDCGVFKESIFNTDESENTPFVIVGYEAYIF